VVKSNPKGFNVLKLMESVVFQDHGIYHFLHCKKNPPISGDFFGKISNQNFEKNFQRKMS